MVKWKPRATKQGLSWEHRLPLDIDSRLEYGGELIKHSSSEQRVSWDHGIQHPVDPGTVETLLIQGGCWQQALVVVASGQPTQEPTAQADGTLAPQRAGQELLALLTGLCSPQPFSPQQPC